MITGFEKASLLQDRAYFKIFRYTIQFLYECDVLDEDAILGWEAERRAGGADCPEAGLLKECAQFLNWLKTAGEEESDDE